ncbi:iron transporter [Virgisporangium aliadipatigenens]|uniref:Iron transporter n=1 Tax=Virgisporangium aliadipatigenens TaxID=741659 RepID=A0A8J3YID3_9ACTN|nr:IucA/IucC family protein [Virgisporangium aliadipatigenens]GIJ45631.1 iron transporter [Virgisporangium aliadipatigenens]
MRSTAARAATAVERTDRDLRALDPALHARWAAALPHATDTAARRLLAALHRERLAGVHTDGGRLYSPAGTVTARHHGFGRAEPVGPLPTEPDAFLDALLSTVDPAGGLAAELDSTVANLALALARRPSTVDPFDGPLDPDARAVAFERLATTGHNLHPCGRTRLGWHTADVLAYDLEAPPLHIAWVGLNRAHLLGDDLGRRLGHPGTRTHAAHPLHPWQRAHLRRTRPDLYERGALRDLDDPGTPAAPTAALRTLHVPGHGYLKLALDIQVTSTRRNISVASTRNGPHLSRRLTDLLDGEPVLLLTEPAAAAGVGLSADRDLSAILRTGLTGALDPGETAVPAGAFTATLHSGRSVAQELLRRHGGSAASFVAGYVRLVVPPLLRLATRYGVGLEAHLQNCLPTFRRGRPHRLVVRDIAGLRLHLPRLAARGGGAALWPGSVVATLDADVMRAKLGYTLFQAHLGELLAHLAATAGLDEQAAWRDVRTVVDTVHEELRADPALRADADADHAFWTAPSMPHKALVSMRLHDDGDRYVPVPNPLRDPPC